MKKTIRIPYLHFSLSLPTFFRSVSLSSRCTEFLRIYAQKNNQIILSFLPCILPINPKYKIRFHTRTMIYQIWLYFTSPQSTGKNTSRTDSWTNFIAVFLSTVHTTGQMSVKRKIFYRNLLFQLLLISSPVIYKIYCLPRQGIKKEQDTGVEPASSAWEADILPMY